MTNLEIAKQIILDGISKGYATCGLFHTRNISGDIMEVIYKDGEFSVELCRKWEYFEVFGLIEEDFLELLNYYRKLKLDIGRCENDK